MSVDLSLLGKDTTYPTQYAPDVLFPISRAAARETYSHIAGISQGTDWWHVFEISWLNPQGKPMVAIGRLHIPANTPNLIESKSLKLYFNSFNFEKHSTESFIATVERDLSKAAGGSIKLELFEVNQLPIYQLEGELLDDLEVSPTLYHPDASILNHRDNTIVEETLYSHLLRSNCPVTNQPDWGTIMIRYSGPAICKKSLLNYIISYRQHNGFHEQCVEQIFADIWQTLQPGKLMVYAAYTRRGGLDINPCRVSDPSWMPTPIRLARQ